MGSQRVRHDWVTFTSLPNSSWLWEGPPFQGGCGLRKQGSAGCQLIVGIVRSRQRHQTGSIPWCSPHLEIGCPGSNPGFATYEQYNLGKGYLVPLNPGFLADRTEEDSTYHVGSLWRPSRMIWPRGLAQQVTPSLLTSSVPRIAESSSEAGASFFLPFSFLICSMWIIMPGLSPLPYNCHLRT